MVVDKKISELNSAGALSGTEIFPIVQSGETKKTSILSIIKGIAALVQGTNTLTGPLSFNLVVGSITYSVSIDTGTISMSITDVDDSSNDSAVVLVPKKVQIAGSLQMSVGLEMQEYPIYWRGNEDSPTEGDIREYYNEGTDEIVTEKYTSGSWAFRGSR